MRLYSREVNFKGKESVEGGEISMRKLLCVVLSITMVLATCMCSFGAVRPDDGVVELQYTSARGVYPSISISSGGTASYSVRVNPKTDSSISYIKATLKLVNSAGTVIKTKTDTIYKSDGCFKISDSKTLSAKGTYHAEYTLKVYNKSDSLVETIKGQSGTAKY